MVGLKKNIETNIKYEGYEKMHCRTLKMYYKNIEYEVKNVFFLNILIIKCGLQNNTKIYKNIKYK